MSKNALKQARKNVALKESNMLEEGKKFTTPEALAKALPKEIPMWHDPNRKQKVPAGKPINRDTMVIPSGVTMREIVKLLDKSGYKYNDKTEVWKQGKHNIGINWNDSDERGSAVMWTESYQLEEKVDIKKLKGPFPFVAKSGKKIDLYNDPSKDKKQWYIPQLDKFVDENEAQKFLKSEEVEQLNEDLKMDPRLREKGEKDIPLTFDGDIVASLKNLGDAWGVEFEPEIDSKMTPKEKSYENRNLQSAMKHAKMIWKKYGALEESNFAADNPIVAGYATKDSRDRHSGPGSLVISATIKTVNDIWKIVGADDNLVKKLRKNPKKRIKVKTKSPTHPTMELQLNEELEEGYTIKMVEDQLEEGTTLQQMSDKELNDVIKKHPNSLFSMEAKQILRFRKKGIKEDSESLNTKEDNNMSKLDEDINPGKNKSSIKTYNQQETDDKGFLEWEQAEDIEELFELMKQAGHTAKAPKTFKGLAVPPDLQKILNQKFSGKGSMAEENGSDEEVVEEGTKPMGHGPGSVSLDQHQMIDDLFNLSKGMGRSRPLKTYKGIQLEGKYNHILLKVQEMLDEHYENLKQERIDEQKSKITGSYLDQISADISREAGKPKSSK